MNENQFQFLAGEVNGLRAVLTALIATHPDRAALGAKLAQLFEDQLALTTPLGVPEIFLEGQAHIAHEFQALVQS